MPTHRRADPPADPLPPTPGRPSLPRRRLLQAGMAWPAASLLAPEAALAQPFRRARPGDPRWPSAEQWQALNQQLGGRLLPLRSPFDALASAPGAESTRRFFSSTLKNPYAIGDDPALTQTLGWTDAWQSRSSVYAAAARSPADVAAAVEFARRHGVRLAVKGGGHSYQGTSNAADSLLVWTRALHDIRLHDAFVPASCAGRVPPQRAVSIGAGAMWGQAYDAVTTQGGGYVQGGGCMTVGVAGLVQSGGFGSFSKAFGLACGSLLEAEVVTADAQVRVVNACTHPDLFWGLKGGGGGSLGVLTRLTLQVHELPASFGIVQCTVQARSDAAWRRLIDTLLVHYRTHLHNPHWGEQLRLRRERRLRVEMVFQGLSGGEADAAWEDFFEWVRAAPTDYRMESAPLVMTVDPRSFWAPSSLKRMLGFQKTDDRPGAPEGRVFWAGDQGQAGQWLHAYGSAWLPQDLLNDAQRPRLVDALARASAQWHVSLHLNKGLAGAAPAAREAARDSAMNPAVLDAFALAISAAEEQPAYPGIAGREPQPGIARERRHAVDAAMAALREAAPQAGSYLSESDFFLADWQQAFWGSNLPRLRDVKARWDPEGLFTVHHGIGSEAWSADGAERLG